MMNIEIDNLKEYKTKTLNTFNGFLVSGLIIGFMIFCVWIANNSFVEMVRDYGIKERYTMGAWFCFVFAFIGFLVLSFGLFILKPNEQAVGFFFGKYVGTVSEEGFHWVNPFINLNKVSMMGSNFETNIMKVNDGNGNPIEIASVIVWRVFDPAKAILSLESYRNFVEQQSESAVREVSGEYPYEKNINGVADDEEGNSMSLTKNRNDIEEILTRTLNNHMNKYGIQVINASFSHLSYAPEIASAMLQRQQAGAIVSARKIIVSASTSMVDDVISHYEKEGSKIDFTNEEKSKLASNLIVVLCSQQDVTPTLPLSRNDHS